MAETNRARQFGFLQTELDRAKASLMNAAEKSFKEKDKSESVAIVQQYINNFLQGNPIPGVEHRYKFLQQVLPTITLAGNKCRWQKKCLLLQMHLHW